jgi:hypothetical protein
MTEQAKPARCVTHPSSLSRPRRAHADRLRCSGNEATHEIEKHAAFGLRLTINHEARQRTSRLERYVLPPATSRRDF